MTDNPSDIEQSLHLSDLKGKVPMIEPIEPRVLLAFFGVDPSFGDAGFVTTNFGRLTQTSVEFLQVLPNGDVLAAGRGTATSAGGGDTPALARYTDNGTLDTTFGDQGKINMPIVDDIEAAAVQADGKIVVVGEKNTQIYVARYTADGQPDLAFGTNGTTSAGFASGSSVDRSGAYSVVLQPDGKIVIAGQREFLNPVNMKFLQSIALARFNADGTLDTAFGTGGLVNTDLANSSYSHDVGLTTDGKILVAGDTIANGVNAGFVNRYSADGSLDATFGHDGTDFLVYGAADGFSTTTRVVPLANQQMLVVERNTVVRLNSDGALDKSFGKKGIATAVPVDEFGTAYIRDVAVDSQGRIDTVADLFSSGVTVSRLTPDGDLDTTFTENGYVT